MVTFRFYVVSTVAFFLALAVGVVVGSALDEDLVDLLRNRITTVAERAERVADENDELRAEEERLRTLLDSAAPHLVDGRLQERPIVVVAERGADAEDVRALRELATVSGAEVPAILWLEEGWQLADESTRAELAVALDVTAGEPEVLRGRAWRLLLAQLGGASPAVVAPAAPATTATTAPAPTTTADTGTSTTAGPPTTLPPQPVDVLGVLDESGLISIEGLAEDGADVRSVMGPELTIVLVTAPETDLTETGFVLQALRLQAEVRMPTVLASLSQDGTPAPPLVEVRSDDSLRERIATVDNAEQPVGRAAVLLAVHDLQFAVVGHYGELEGATRGLPEWTDRAVAPG